jgi:hypothetical protein
MLHMPGRSMVTLVLGLAVGTMIGAQIHGAVAGSTPCAPATATSWLVSKTVVPKATPRATAKPSPTVTASGPALINLSGSFVAQTETDSPVFKAPGVFTIHYTSTMLDSALGVALFAIEVYSVDKSIFDPVLFGLITGSKPTPHGKSVIRSDDCSKGCYLKVTASNLRYSIQVTK